jgi:hypothetical protein
VAAAVAEPALAEADAQPLDDDGGGDAELLPGGADAFGPEGEAVGADPVPVAVEVVDALVFGAGFAEDGVGLVRLPDGQEAGEVGCDGLRRWRDLLRRAVRRPAARLRPFCGCGTAALSWQPVLVHQTPGVGEPVP